MLSLKSLISPRFVTYTNFVRHLKTKRDPGIGARKKLVSLINEQEDFTEYEDLESDFMDVHKSHKEHLREQDLMKEKVKYHIVKQKYFKTKFPNFLTWHDKEQIRYLHRTDPEEWSIERLSEGFPALPETIKKIVKSNWVKTKQNKITNHDSAVQQNWKLFKEGQMSDLPDDLQQHLNKFSNRALNFKPFVMPESQKNKVNNYNGEFSEIIKSYQNLQIGSNEIIGEKVSKPPLQETYTNSKKSKNLVTLHQLEDNVKRKIEIGKNIDYEEKRIITNLKPKEEKTDSFIDLSLDKYQKSNTLQVYTKTERDLTHLNYPEKITIPKKISKKGFTYKLNDCYYDDDGEFLYRVPGMG